MWHRKALRPPQRKSMWHCAEFWGCGPSQTTPRIANDTLQQPEPQSAVSESSARAAVGAQLCEPLNRINVLRPDWCRRERSAKVRAISRKGRENDERRGNPSSFAFLASM